MENTVEAYREPQEPLHAQEGAPTGFADGAPSIGVGIIGLSASGGWAAGGHVPALSEVDGIELRALAASSPDSARAAGKVFGVPAYASVEQLVQDGSIDLVVVSVKVPQHRELILPALKAGVPVLAEWPLARNLPEAEELVRSAQGTRTFVGLQGQSSPTFRWLADLVLGGYVGEMLSATVVASYDEWGSPVSENMRYLLDRRLGATMLTIAVGHALDWVSMIVGEPKDLMATTATERTRVPLAGSTGQFVPMTAEDQVAISATLPNGAVLSAHHRGRSATGPGFSLVIDGTEGALEVVAPMHPHITQVTVRGIRGRGRPVELTMPDSYDKYPHLSGTAIHNLAHAYSAIRDDLLHGTTNAPDFSHGVKRHRLLDAITRSAATGRRVTVDGHTADVAESDLR
ncbi:Gfo/Idh/MocA family oxidoreductase [Streptomyces sp. NPDC001185]|uniref:Gfo/Idh/MocA family protein n=1 Tax=Streptomyces sp. NPDC001185 TaxID=3154380 RepID=UPI00332BB975